jgi:hypothetical protein
MLGPTNEKARLTLEKLARFSIHITPPLVAVWLYPKPQLGWLSSGKLGICTDSPAVTFDGSSTDSHHKKNPLGGGLVHAEVTALHA